MIIALYIFLGLLLFDCLIACSLYFRKENPFNKYEEYSKYLETENLSFQNKIVKDNRTSDLATFPGSSYIKPTLVPCNDLDIFTSSLMSILKK